MPISPTPVADTDFPVGGDILALYANVDGTGGSIKGKPVLTLDQITAVINRTSYPGEGIGSPGWNQGEYGAPSRSGQPNTITFGFHNEDTIFAPPYVQEDPDTGELFGLSQFFAFQEFSNAQKAAARSAIQLWDDVIAYRITETTADKADITYGNYTNQPGTQAYAYLPYDYGDPSDYEYIAGDVWVNGNEPSNLQLDFGDYGPITLQHETGHAIGLQHPGAYNAAPGLSITYAANAEYYQDSRQYTIMSYFGAENTGAAHINWANLTFVYSQTPLIHDIATAQKVYGVDTTTRTGDTVYGFNSTADRDVYNFNLNTLPVLAIWDAGGNDTLDLSGFNTSSSIDLAPGAFSSGGGSGVVPLETLKAQGILPPTYTQAQYDALRARYNSPDGLLHDNISIAYGATIENAVGGGGNDTILGNTVANQLTGLGGNDTIRGLAGADRLFGNAGADSLFGDDGSDQLYGDADNDTLDGGADGDTLYGGDGADTLIGGTGNDGLFGGAGADVMRGGIGDDRYYVDDATDQVSEGVSEGSDTVVSTLASYRLGTNVETLELAGIGDLNGSGNDADNTIRGNAGANSLQGLGGNDVLYGLVGDDALAGGLGDDVIDGGDGLDTIGFKVGATSGVGVDLAKAGRQQTGQGNDLIRGVENLEGTTFADTLYGDANANKLIGLDGADTLRGRGGNDDLYGGVGADRFVFDSAATNGVDRIRDFVSGTDKLVFYTADGYAANAGWTAGTAASGTGAQFVYDDRSDRVWYDADGVGGADQILMATLAPSSLVSSDHLVLAGTIPAI